MKRLLFAIVALAMSAATFAQQMGREEVLSKAVAILNNEHYHRGLSYFVSGDYDNAAENFLSAFDTLTLNDDIISYLLFIGVYDFELLRDKLTDRIAYYLTLDLGPDLEVRSICTYRIAQLYSILGSACENHGRFGQAIEAYRCDGSEVYDPGSLYESVAECYANLNLFDEAIVNIDKAISVEPDKIRYQRNKGDILYSKGDLDGAADVYASIIKNNIVGSQILCQYGNILCQQGDIKGGIKEFNKAIVCDAGYGRAILARGLAYQKLGEKIAALNDLNKLLEYDDYFYRQYALIALGRSDEVDISVNARIIDNDSDAYYHAAILCTALGNVEDAISYLRLAAENSGLMFFVYCADPLLASLRATKEYKEFIGELSRAK